MQQITWSGVLPAALTMFTVSGEPDRSVDLWRAIPGSDLAAARAAWNRILPIKLLCTSQ